MFVDEAKICVRGGDGGNGCVSFHREKFRPKGGPDGGDGGDGGDVIMRADPSVAALSVFKKKIHWKAGRGAHGSGNNKAGRSGSDLEILVPCGTTIRDHEGTLLADLVRPGEEALIALGGAGGRGNAAFKSRSRPAPRIAENGEAADELWVSLELRLLADAALIGMPNAGKSTLLAQVSEARPKIAPYPFTTLEPHLGVVWVGDTEVVLADVPGLIEGASRGKGLGDRFLRHIERARVMVIMLDLASAEGLSPEDQEKVLLGDLAAHDQELCRRPRLTVANKIDIAPHEFARLHAVRPDILGISAMTGECVDELLVALAEAVVGARVSEPERVGFVLHRPALRGFAVESEDGAWRIRGREAERAASLVEFDDADTVDYLRSRMRALGVDDALASAGVLPGDEVRVGSQVFEWEPDEIAADGSSESERKKRG